MMNDWPISVTRALIWEPGDYGCVPSALPFRLESTRLYFLYEKLYLLASTLVFTAYTGFLLVNLYTAGHGVGRATYLLV